MSAWDKLSMSEKADVMKLALEGGVYDLDSIRSGYNKFAEGGRIHIKPENRGKFTTLKERTGHSATWFKEHGTPAQKKMATFALNAKKWKHGLGGNLFDGEENHSQQMFVREKNNNPIAFDSEGNLTDQVTGDKGTIVLPEVSIRPEKNILPVPSAATFSQWLKGTMSYLTGIKDKDLIESKYRPSQETNTETKYYTRKGLDYDVMKNLLGGIESDARTIDGENLYYKDFNDLYDRLSKKSHKTGRELRVTDNSQLGEYTIGIGQDAGGRYVSYYDKFDWAPKEELELFSPYEIYNRIYEKDFDRMQRELSREKYSGSNPIGSWFFKSGLDNTGYNLHGLGGNLFDGTSQPTQQMQKGHAIYLHYPNATGGAGGAVRVGGIDLGRAFSKVTGINSLPVGHAGLVLVDEGGNSTYYDYGRYKEGADAYGVSTFGSVGKRGNWRKKKLPKQKVEENDSVYMARIQKELPDTHFGSYQALSFQNMDVPRIIKSINSEASDPKRKKYGAGNNCSDAASRMIIPFLPAAEVLDKSSKPSIEEYNTEGYSIPAQWWSLIPMTAGYTAGKMRKLADKTYIMNKKK